jgi:hypothetical protein
MPEVEIKPSSLLKYGGIIVPIAHKIAEEWLKIGLIVEIEPEYEGNRTYTFAPHKK